MKQEKKQRKIGWTPLRAAGIALSVLGIAMLLYGAYALLMFVGMRTGAYGTATLGAPGNYSFSGTAPNGATFARHTSSLPSGAYPIFSGVLMLLLGITVFKYGGLRAYVAGQK